MALLERLLPRLQSQTVHELRRHGAPPNPLPFITASVVCQKCKFSDSHLDSNCRTGTRAACEQAVSSSPQTHWGWKPHRGKWNWG